MRIPHRGKDRGTPQIPRQTPMAFHIRKARISLERRKGNACPAARGKLMDGNLSEKQQKFSFAQQSRTFEADAHSIVAWGQSVKFDPWGKNASNRIPSADRGARNGKKIQAFGHKNQHDAGAIQDRSGSAWPQRMRNRFWAQKKPGSFQAAKGSPARRTSVQDQQSWRRGDPYAVFSAPSATRAPATMG